jgi:hypothetical protein
VWYTQPVMKKKLCQKFNSSVTIIIAPSGIAVAIAVASLDLVQSASAATTDMVAGTFEGEEESLNTTSTTNNKIQILCWVSCS